MKYTIKGNYFNGEFHFPITSGPQAVEHFLKRECPSDTETILWEMPIEYRHIPDVLESAQHGFKFWRKLSVDERIVFLKDIKNKFFRAKIKLLRP